MPITNERKQAVDKALLGVWEPRPRAGRYRLRVRVFEVLLNTPGIGPADCHLDPPQPLPPRCHAERRCRSPSPTRGPTVSATVAATQAQPTRAPTPRPTQQPTPPPKPQTCSRRRKPKA